MDPVICFSFIPLESRQNTMDSSASFRIESPNLSKYLADSDNILNVLLKFCLMEFKGVVKFDLSSLNEEDLASYGLLNPAYTITFKQNGLSGSNGSTYSGQNILYISAITEAGSYYVASDVWNMIVEIDSDYLAFLDWTPIKWVDRPFFQVDISYMEKMEFTKGDTTYTIFFDNSASEAVGGSENLRLYVNNGEITDIQNFRQFYKSILQASIEGPADSLTEEEKDAFRQMEDTDPAIQMILRYRATDPAGRTDDRVIRFYRYSQEKSFITIDGQGEFYVLHSYVEKVYNDLLKVLAGEPVDHTSKF